MLNKMQLQTLRTLVEQASHERLHALVQSDKVSAQDAEYQFYQELLGELKVQAKLDNGWISVEYDTPEHFKDVLCFGDGHYEIASYDGDDFYDAEERLVICTHWQALPQPPEGVNMKKQLNPLQPLIDEMHQNKKLHSQLAQNAESENNRYNDNYVHFEKGVAYGFELAIEMLAKFQSWNDARTNPPELNWNRECPYFSRFLCVSEFKGRYIICEEVYDFRENKWFNESSEVMYWQEYPTLPKSLLK